MENSNQTVNVELLTKPFDPSLIRFRQGGGGKQLAYYEGHVIIQRLNEATGNNWNFEVVRLWSEGDLMLAHVRLTLPGLGSREQIGVQKVAANGGEDLVKGCVTDALKKAATLFGVALELYEDKPQPQARPAYTPRPAPAPASGNGNGELKCEGCGGPMSVQERNFSTHVNQRARFGGKALCKSCQAKARAAAH